MFHNTQPKASDLLMRVSEFEREHGRPHGRGDTEAGATPLSALNPSLLQDLLRFEQRHRPGAGLNLLEEMADALRQHRVL